MTAPTTAVVVRYYLDGGAPKTEAVRWQWAPPAADPIDGKIVDLGLAARARPLPEAVDPGLVPNAWVWVGANDPAVVLPRPDEVERGQESKADGTVVDTVDNHHHDRSAYWNYYKLPLRPGVEIVEESVYRAAVEESAKVEGSAKETREKSHEARRATRQAARATARAKLVKLGLSDAEVTAIIGS